MTLSHYLKIPSRRGLLLGLGAAALAAPNVALAASSQLFAIIPHDRQNGLGDPVTLDMNLDYAWQAWQFEAVCADKRTGEMRAMDANLFTILGHIALACQAQGMTGDIRLNSGYRTQASQNLLRKRGFSAAKKSLHTQGMAADIEIAGLPARAIYVLASNAANAVLGDGNTPGGGVMLYQKAQFVHIDTRPGAGFRTTV